MSDWFKAEKPLIIGHRGASGEAPENTISACSLAVQQAADGIEIDVQLSADGQVVVMHDASVDRTTNGVGFVSDLTAEQLLSLDAGENQPVPLLDHIFETFGASILYNIELKGAATDGSKLVMAVADSIKKHGLENLVVVSSFNPLILGFCPDYLSPDVPLALIRAPGLETIEFRITGARADHPHFSLVDVGYMDWARENGYRVHVWTVDDIDTAQELAEVGVHGIITNYPNRLRQLL